MAAMHVIGLEPYARERAITVTFGFVHPRTEMPDQVRHDVEW